MFEESSQGTLSFSAWLLLFKIFTSGDPRSKGKTDLVVESCHTWNLFAALLDKIRAPEELKYLFVWQRGKCKKRKRNAGIYDENWTDSGFFRMYDKISFSKTKHREHYFISVKINNEEYHFFSIPRSCDLYGFMVRDDQTHRVFHISVEKRGYFNNSTGTVHIAQTQQFRLMSILIPLAIRFWEMENHGNPFNRYRFHTREKLDADKR